MTFFAVHSVFSFIISSHIQFNGKFHELRDQNQKSAVDVILSVHNVSETAVVDRRFQFKYSFTPAAVLLHEYVATI